jgi:Superoxide dismutase
MTHTHPKLPYAFNALEPYIDEETMQLHHGKHHHAAVHTLINAVAGTDAEHMTVEELLANISGYPTLHNCAGSHYNHSQFWQVLSPLATQPMGNLLDAINAGFGSLAGLKEKMSLAGAAHFGSGWVWLILKDGSLEITVTPNQDNPLMDIAATRGTPLLGIDIWEHAYYLKYQNRRSEYLVNIWNVINWQEVERRFNQL